MVPLLLAVHTLGAVIWVGGMFFAHMALRPALAETSPAERLALWRRVFPRFFRWVWISVVALLITGYAVIVWGYGGFAGLAPHINIMQATGLLMIVLYVYLYFGPYRAFQQAMADGDLAGAASEQAKIRQIITINLPLGLLTSAIGATGGFWTY